MKPFFQRSEVVVGLVVGAILTLAIAGSLDLFIPLNEGGWSEAIRKSIFVLFGPQWENVFTLQVVVGFTAIFFVTLLGALIGVLFALLLSGFFKKMFHMIENQDGE